MDRQRLPWLKIEGNIRGGAREGESYTECQYNKISGKKNKLRWHSAKLKIKFVPA